jgi:hypothetical protein
MGAELPHRPAERGTSPMFVALLVISSRDEELESITNWFARQVLEVVEHRPQPFRRFSGVWADHTHVELICLNEVSELEFGCSASSDV